MQKIQIKQMKQYNQQISQINQQHLNNNNVNIYSINLGQGPEMYNPHMMPPMFYDPIMPVKL